MITQVKRGGVVMGVTVSGTLSREPIHKTLGGKPVLSLSVRAHSEKNASGNYDSTFVEVLCWGGIEGRDGMYEKGDYITAEGRELRRDDKGNGKVYYSLNATGITPGDLVVLRWMQMAINIAVGPAEPSAPPESSPPVPQPFESASDAPPDAPLPAPTLAGAELYPGESLADYPPPGQRPQQPPEDGLDRLIEETAADDLPF